MGITDAMNSASRRLRQCRLTRKNHAVDRFQGLDNADVRPLDAPPATPREGFDLAEVRKAELGLDYAGAVTPAEAWALVQAQAATLIDVRTTPEFKFVGHVPGSANVEWHGKDEAPRASFVRALRAA